MLQPCLRRTHDASLAAVQAVVNCSRRVDIPSGWNVMEGNSNDGFTPNAIISLTAPKVGVKEFAEAGGTHYLGGRFISGQMDLKYGLNLP